MSKRPITEGALRYQALRCETAKHKRCKCRCGGAFHGIHHDDAWIKDEVLRDQLARQPGQIDWVEEFARPG